MGKSPNIDIGESEKELSPTPLVSGYLLVSPTGQRLAVDKAVFEAFRKFKTERSTGSIQLHFKSGGIAGVKTIQEETLK